MSVPLVALLVVMPLALAVAVGVVVITLAHRLSRRERAVTPSTALVAARRHAGSIDALAWVGLVAALVILQVFTPSLTNGLGTGVLIGLTPTLAGATFLAVQSVGELTWPRPSGPVRRAPLTPRTVRTLAPVGLRRLTWVWAGGLATTLVACGLASGNGRDIERVWDAASSGAAGPFPGWFYGGPLLVATAVVVAATEVVLLLVGLRRLTWVWAGGLATTLVACGLASGNGRDIERVWDAASSGAAGPFPGWFYGGPLLVATAVVVVATEVVLLLVARRPAVADTAPADDLALRTVSARRVLRGTQLVLAWTLAGVLFVAGTALRSVGTIEVDGVGRTSVGLVAGGTTLLLLGLAVALAGPLTMVRTTVAAPARSAATAGRALHAASDPVAS
jgi:hypothetical protein